MSYSIDRENQGPGWFEVIFAAWLAMALGVLLAACFLILKPATTTASLPPADQREGGQVFYIPGNTDPMKGKAWLRKRSAWIEGQSIELIEEELNSAFTLSETPKPAKPRLLKKGEVAPPPPPLPSMVVGSPNFRITEEHLQMALPIQLNDLGLLLIVQTSGHFEKIGEAFHFKPDQTYIGSLPLHLIPRAQEEFYKRLMERSPLPEDLLETWSKLGDIRIEDKRLKLDMP